MSMRDQARATADTLRAIIEACERGELAATPGEVSRLAGAARACESIAARPPGEPAQVRRGRRPEVAPEVAERIRAARDRGDSLRQIAEDLNGAGVPTARGGRWQASTVRAILAGPR